MCESKVFHVASDALLFQQHLSFSPLEEARTAPVQGQAAGEEAQGQAEARLPPHHTTGGSTRSLRHSRALGWAH